MGFSQFHLLTPFVFSLVFLTGCGGSSRIEGTVTLDGQPVDGGTISFINTSCQGHGGNAVGQIQGGKYSIESELDPGKYKVEINWPKSTGKTIPDKSDVGTTGADGSK